MSTPLPLCCATPSGLRVVADEEALPFADASLDMVVSGLSLQLVNDLPGTLVQMRRALKPDGLLLASLLGGATLTELREAWIAAEAEISGGASPRVAPFADVRDMGSAAAARRLCAAGGQIPRPSSSPTQIRLPSCKRSRLWVQATC